MPPPRILVEPEESEVSRVISTLSPSLTPERISTYSSLDTPVVTVLDRPVDRVTYFWPLLVEMASTGTSSTSCRSATTISMEAVMPSLSLGSSSRVTVTS